MITMKKSSTEQLQITQYKVTTSRFYKKNKRIVFLSKSSNFNTKTAHRDSILLILQYKHFIFV